MCILRTSDGQSNHKRGALSLTFTVNLNRSFMKCHKLSHNIEAKAETPVIPGRCRIGLAKTIKDKRQELRIDADTGVLHRDLNLRIRSFQLDAYGSSLGSKLHGIAQEVPDDLLQTLRIARNQRKSGSIVDSRRIFLDSASGLTPSSAVSITDGRLTFDIVSCILLEMIRETSKKSEISCVWKRAFRWIASTARTAWPHPDPRS